MPSLVAQAFVLDLAAVVSDRLFALWLDMLSIYRHFTEVRESLLRRS